MIDAKIQNGDVAADPGGSPVMLSGTDAAFQRAVICMTAPKGSFVYDRELGTLPCVPDDSERLALVFSEALAGFEDTVVESVRLEESAAFVTLTAEGETREVEVCANRSV